MRVSDLIAEVHAAGGRIAADGPDLVLTAPSPLPGELVAQVKAHKPAILAALSKPDSAVERALSLLRKRPEITHAYAVVDPSTDPVRLAVAIRGVGSCELLIPRERFDPFEIIEFIHARGAGGVA